MKQLQLFLIVLTMNFAVMAKEYHVAKTGNDTNKGTLEAPLLTIQAAAELARPGDVITVHEGTYRELINPMYGGISETNRIVYQAASGEEVIVKGSEIVNNWEPLKNGVWKITLPHTFFGNYNPYRDSISGDWFTPWGRIHHPGEVYLNGKSLYEVETLTKVMEPSPLDKAQDQQGSLYTWYCESNDNSVTIWANFHESNPNRELSEINVRKACFYPEKTGVNYITVRGFQFRQAATPWAPPTAEQIGMVGTNWSKGWIIENNIISDSKCTGITLGKDRKSGQNVASGDITKPGEQHYIEVIFRALRLGWDKENVGSHIIRNNTIYNCEQAGICGSMGAAFSTITGNHIYNIWTKRQFKGIELGGIKLHGAIDVLISNNRIHNCLRGIWMDWMAQGARVSGNLLYNNNDDDIFFEVTHGPFLVDNNISLSKLSINHWAQGGAFVHNLFGGKVFAKAVLDRHTPYHFQHSTQVAGLTNTLIGDERYYNNIFTIDKTATSHREKGHYNMDVYDIAKLPMRVESNLYFNGYEPYNDEQNSIVDNTTDPEIKIDDRGEEVYLHINVGESFFKLNTQVVNTALLGKAKAPDALFENPDGTPLAIDTDFLGNYRSETKPVVGPLEKLKPGKQVIRVW